MKTILVDAYNTFVTDKGVNNQMQEMLDGFPNTKIILTNADEEKQKELGLVDLPYEMFTQNFNPMKSEPEFYNNFLRDYGLGVNDVIYFEHNQEAVGSARTLGIETYHYDKDEKNTTELEEFLKNNI